MTVKTAYIRIVTFAIFANIIFQVKAEKILTDQVDLSCSRGDSSVLNCSYRPVDDISVTEISINTGENENVIVPTLNYPQLDSVTSVLIVLDTSDPTRQDVIDKNIIQIEQILNNTQPHHIYGLATLDKELNLKASLGTAPGEIINILGDIKASELSTELYRNLIRSIEILGSTNADRKVVLLFSDGQAEDQAYYHDDVIKVSRQYGVVINSLGFAQTPVLSVALQTIRRLSEETGGRFLESDTNFELPGLFFSAPFANIDRGGYFKYDLSESDRVVSGESVLSINFKTVTGQIDVSLPVILPEQEIPQQIVQPIAIIPENLVENGFQQVNTVQAASEQAASVLNAITSDRTNMFLWYGLVAMFILFTLMITITFLQLRNQQNTQAVVRSITNARRKPLAYLITQDEDARHISVTHSIWRIGRSLDNEMTLNDNSISRRHAEIHRENNGQFYVYDRESTNGVYVNNRKVIKHRLSEGDIIEIGDILLRFTQYPKDYQLGEQTSRFRTRLPEVS